MRTRLSAALVAVLVLAVACGGEEDTPRARDPRPTPSAPQPTESFNHAAALIDTRDGSVIVRVEVAQTDEQRMQGLMFRESLPEDHGMVFIWFEEHSGGFWMKNTLIPLSIAFFDEEGKIVSILDMDPCEADPCEVYDPGVPYYGALEVNRGMFDEWGVRRGDTITLSF
jgi:uncharacterized protein